MFDLTGRVALVTGAGSASGIGFASAIALARMGAAVAVTSTTDRIHDRVRELQAQGARACGVSADLTDVLEVAAVVEGVTQEFGGIDIVVNNAGMVSVSDTARVAGDTESGGIGMSLAGWHAALQRNLDTAFLVCQAVVPSMRERRWGRIVNVASVTGPVMAMRQEIAYATAKAGMVGLTRAVAVDEARHGVTVNAVAPGWIATSSQLPDEERQGRRTPMGRSARPEEVAAAIAFLCSAEASYVTGTCLVIDGGNAIAEERA